jgi:transposase
MPMGRKTPRQQPLLVAPARTPGHPFYEKLNGLLAEANFDAKVEALCERFYDEEAVRGATSVPPGVYFRMLLIGYFEGIESERGLEWRCQDSLSLKDFLGLPQNARVPDHSTLSRTRKRLPGEIYDAVFQLALGIVQRKGLLKGKVAGVDSTYLRADASMKNIVRKDTGEDYAEYLKRLAKDAGIEEPTVEDARRMDRARKGKKTSNRDWKSGTDEDARIARLKDGRTRLAYKPEHVVDLETGAILSAEVFAADEHDTATMKASLDAAVANVEAVTNDERKEKDDDDDSAGPGPSSNIGESWHREPTMEVAADKGYFKAQLLADLKEAGYRTYIPEPVRRHPRRRFVDKGGTKTAHAVHQNLARVKRPKSKALQRRRGELVERPFAHICETGGHRRTRLRGRENVRKRYLVQVAAANLGLVMRTLFGRGTPRGLADARRALAALIRVLAALWTAVVASASALEVGQRALRAMSRSLALPRLTRSTGC